MLNSSNLHLFFTPDTLNTSEDTVPITSPQEAENEAKPADVGQQPEAGDGLRLAEAAAPAPESSTSSTVDDNEFVDASEQGLKLSLTE